MNDLIAEFYSFMTVFLVQNRDFVFSARLLDNYLRAGLRGCLMHPVTTVRLAGMVRIGHDGLVGVVSPVVPPWTPPGHANSLLKKILCSPVFLCFPVRDFFPAENTRPESPLRNLGTYSTEALWIFSWLPDLERKVNTALNAVSPDPYNNQQSSTALCSK